MSGKYLHEENSRTLLTVESFQIKTKTKVPQYIAAIFATLGAFSSGAFISWSSSALALLQGKDAPLSLSNEQESWAVSILLVGACMGAIPAGSMVNKFGRKTTLQMLAILMIFSWFLIGLSTVVCVVWVLLVGRLLAGICIGAISVAAPLYISELAEPRIRGTLGTFFQLQMTLGILYEYVVGSLTDNFALLAIISTFCPIIFLTVFSFMPESPVYLCSNGQDQQARASLQWFRGKDYDIIQEYILLSDTVRQQQNTQININDLFHSKATLRALIISLGLMVFQQMCGVTAFISYTDKIFEYAGSKISPNICSITVGVVQVIATYISSLLMDRAGRRILLIVSDGIMTICLFALSLFFYTQTNKPELAQSYSFVPLVSIALYIIVFSLGFGPIPWLMMGEIFPPHIKSLASSIAAAFNWILASIVAKIFPSMLDYLGLSNTFGLFALICLLGTVFVLSFVPETKGKSIDEIQKLLAYEAPKETDSKFILSVDNGTKISLVV